MLRSRSAGLVILLIVTSARARAQEPPRTPPPDPPEEEERSTGLPKKDAWTFNLDAGIAAFGFGNSL